MNLAQQTKQPSSSDSDGCDKQSDSKRSDTTQASGQTTGTSSSVNYFKKDQQSKVPKFIDKDGQIKETIPRDFYTQKETWSRDKTKGYFMGPRLKYILPITKLGMLIALGLFLGYGLEFSTKWVMFGIFVAIAIYQHVIAAFYGLKYMAPMDQQCFCSSKQTNINYMSVTGIEGEHFDEAYFRNIYKTFATKHEKFAYKIVEKFGDLYYEKMEVDEAVERGCSWIDDSAKAPKTYHEIDCYIRDNINKKVPLDGPQWRAVGMKFKDENHKTCAVQIWKCHHSFMDGVSCMALTAASSKEFKRDYFVKSKDASYLQELLVKLSIVFYIPVLFMNTLFTFRDRNSITKGKKNMTGNVNVSSAKNLDMQELKDLSKKIGVTVNDVLMCATTAALKEYFRIRGDKIGDPEVEGQTPPTVQVLLPANIRFRWYPTADDVTPENKFAALPIKLPIIANMKDSYKPISKITKKLKGTIGYIYAAYAVTYLANIFGCRFIPRFFLHKASMKFTLGISNTPGPVKPFIFEHENGQQSFYRWCQPYVLVAGRVGLCVSAMSYEKTFRICITADESVCQDTTFLVDKIRSNIQNEIDRMRDTKVPESALNGSKKEN